MEIQVTNHLLQPGQTSQSPCWFSPWAGTHTAPCKSSFALGACLLGKTGKAALRRGTCSTGKVPETLKWHVELCSSPTHHFIRCRLNRIGSKANVKSWFRPVKNTVLKHLPPKKKKKSYLQITGKFSSKYMAWDTTPFLPTQYCEKQNCHRGSNSQGETCWECSQTQYGLQVRTWVCLQTLDIHKSYEWAHLPRSLKICKSWIINYDFLHKYNNFFNSSLKPKGICSMRKHSVWMWPLFKI